MTLKVNWSTFQNIIDACRTPDTRAGKVLMRAEINAMTSMRAPRGFTGIITMGRTLKRRAGDILAYFEHTQDTRSHAEAIDGHVEHLHGFAVEFRNLPTTSPERASKPAGSNPNYTPIMKSVING